MKVAVDCSHHLIAGGIRTYLENMLWHLGLESMGASERELLLYYRGLSKPSEILPLPEGSHSRVVHMRAPRKWLTRLEHGLGYPNFEFFGGSVDVLHATHFAMPCTRSSVHRVLTVHDLTYLRHPEFYSDQKLNDYGYKKLLGHALKNSDRVIALSHSTKNDLIEFFNVDPDKIWIIPHGVDPRIQPANQEQQRAIKRKLGLRDRYIIYPVGTIDLRKNLQRCLHSYAQAFPLQEDRPQLLLTGVGDMTQDFEKLVAELKLSEDVLCARVGYPDDLCALYGAALFGLYPSLYEGFGLPPLEAMACGLPMLVSNRTSCPEVVDNAALVADPYDIEEMAAGMVRLAEEKPLREDLKERALKRAHSPAFSWNRAAQQQWAAYEDDYEKFAQLPQPLVGSQLKLKISGAIQ